MLFLPFCLAFFFYKLHKITGLALQDFTQACDCLGIQTASAVFECSQSPLTDQLLLADFVSCVAFGFE